MNGKFTLTHNHNGIETVVAFVINSLSTATNSNSLLSIRVNRGQFPHLSEEGWTESKTWLEPTSVTHEKDRVEFRIGGAIAKQLARDVDWELDLRISVKVDGKLIVDGARSVANIEEPKPTVADNGLNNSLAQAWQDLPFKKFGMTVLIVLGVALLLIVIRPQQEQPQQEKTQPQVEDRAPVKAEPQRLATIQAPAAPETERWSKPIQNTENANASQTATDFVRSYYVALDRQDVKAAVTMWETPPKNLIALVRKFGKSQIDNIRLENSDGDVAAVWVEVTIKARGGATEHWQGNFKLNRGTEGWRLVSMQMGRMGANQPSTMSTTAAPAGLAGYDELTALVRRYYATLERHDVEAVRTMRKNVPANFDAIVQSTDYFKVNDARVASVDGQLARVWVDIVGKTTGHGAKEERWMGEVELEQAVGGWIIASFKGLKKQKGGHGRHT